MAQFVVILEYGGGTYVSKVSAPHHASAVNAWVLRELPVLIKYIRKAAIQRIIRGIEWDRDNSSEFPAILAGLPEVAYVWLGKFRGHCNQMHLVRCK